MKNRIHVSAVLMAIMCILSLTSCQLPPSSTDEPVPSHSTTNAATPSKSVKLSTVYQAATAQGPAKNVKVPRMPERARENSKDGAAAFAEYYFDLVNYVIETNDTSLIKKATTHQCAVCAFSVIDPADQAHREGRWQVGGRHYATVVNSVMSGKNLAIVTVSYKTDASEFYVEPKKIESELDPLEATRVVLGLEFDGSWKVYKLIGEG